MPELIKLQTPDFELSIWAHDIDSRLSVYEKTKRHRLYGDSGTDKAYATEIRLTPELSVENLEINGAQRFNNPDSAGKYSIIPLKAPIFFENTQYQFECVFYGKVANAFIAHRNHVFNEGFRFSPASNTIPARLTGTINTRNDVGWIHLPLQYELDGKHHSQSFALEVFPIKMLLDQDLPSMYQAIDTVYPLWRFSLSEKTEQDVGSNRNRGHFPIMWLANFSNLRARFEQGLKIICASPHSRLKSHTPQVKAARLKGKIPHKLHEQIQQDFKSGQYDKRYKTPKKYLSVDTPENRFVKMSVLRCKQQLAEFEEKLRKAQQSTPNQRLSNSFLNELQSWQQPLKALLNQSFFKEVGPYTEMSRESLVLQQKTGYSAVYRVWQELKFYLDIFAHHSSISMKSVAEIYEVWCFLCIKQLLEDELGFHLIENNAADLTQNDFFEYQLKDGFAGAFRFKRADGIIVRLAHEPKFTQKGTKIRSYLVSQEPDIVLEVTFPQVDERVDQKQCIWIFDAKYRIKTNLGRFDESVTDSIDRVPDDAINQMHRYRDALIHLSQTGSKYSGQYASKSRPVFGAFALYPGFFDQQNAQNPYRDAIEEVGIGAFALLPSQNTNNGCGHQWLLQFLKDQIGDASVKSANLNSSHSVISEHLYVQNASRIPHYGMQQRYYPDLILTAAVGPSEERSANYYDKFKSGVARWYHIRQDAISIVENRSKEHIINEISYLAISLPDEENNCYQISKIWPVKKVVLVPRYNISEEQSGKSSVDDKLYFLFELGNPLTLHQAIGNVEFVRFRDSLKLTTLSKLENITDFNAVEEVYLRP